MLPKKTKRTRIAEAEAEMMLKKKIHQDRMDEKGAILDKEFELCVHQEKVESLASSKLPENKVSYLDIHSVLILYDLACGDI